MSFIYDLSAELDIYIIGKNLSDLPTIIVSKSKLEAGSFRKPWPAKK